MKKLLIGSVVILGIGAVLLCTPGCKTVSKQVVGSDGQTNTVQETKLDAEATASVIRAVVPAGVGVAFQKDPNSLAYFRAAYVVITTALNSGAYDADQLKLALDNISIRELRGPEAQACIQAALGIYRAYAGQVVSQKLDQVEWLRPVLQAVADGINQGLIIEGQ